MESPMLKMLKSQNPDKEYPASTGQKWTDDEEKLLLEELSKNMDIETIAQTHKRTIGGINSRLKVGKPMVSPTTPSYSSTASGSKGAPPPGRFAPTPRLQFFYKNIFAEGKGRG
jgi:hypothetical protein